MKGDALLVETSGMACIRHGRVSMELLFGTQCSLRWAGGLCIDQSRLCRLCFSFRGDMIKGDGTEAIQEGGPNAEDYQNLSLDVRTQVFANTVVRGSFE